jgi:formate-dependent nitrite reductase membrane component NrfD
MVQHGICWNAHVLAEVQQQLMQDSSAMTPAVVTILLLWLDFQLMKPQEMWEPAVAAQPCRSKTREGTAAMLRSARADTFPGCHSTTPSQPIC